jgi:hypothetical protein
MDGVGHSTEDDLPPTAGHGQTEAQQQHGQQARLGRRPGSHLAIEEDGDTSLDRFVTSAGVFTVGGTRIGRGLHINRFTITLNVTPTVVRPIASLQAVGIARHGMTGLGDDALETGTTIPVVSATLFNGLAEAHNLAATAPATARHSAGLEAVRVAQFGVRDKVAVVTDLTDDTGEAGAAVPVVSATVCVDRSTDAPRLRGRIEPKIVRTKVM